MTARIVLPSSLPLHDREEAESEFARLRAEAEETVRVEARRSGDDVRLVGPGREALARLSLGFVKPRWLRLAHDWRRLIVYSGPLAILAGMAATFAAGPVSEQVQHQHTATWLLGFAAWILLVMIAVSDWSPSSVEDGLGLISSSVWGIGSEAVYAPTLFGGIAAFTYDGTMSLDKGHLLGLDVAILRGDAGHEAWLPLDGNFEDDPAIELIRSRLEGRETASAMAQGASR